MKQSKFGEAFASARKAGKKTFEFGGKSYTTETKEEKAGATAKKAVRSFSANAVPGRRQAKPKPSGGGSVATPSRGPSKERRGAGAIGRGGKEPFLPRTTPPEDPITLGKLAKAGAKGVATGIAAGVPLVRAGRGVLGSMKAARAVRDARTPSTPAPRAAEAPAKAKPAYEFKGSSAEKPAASGPSGKITRVRDKEYRPKAPVRRYSREKAK